MANLTQQDRNAVYSSFIASLTQSAGETIGITKQDLIAAVAATDVWADSVSAAYNAALPQPARGALTTRQKARLLMAVITQRYKVS